MLGYSKGIKGNRLWCCESGNQKIIISRDVVFNEECMPFVKVESIFESKPNVEVELNKNIDHQIEEDDSEPSQMHEN